MMAEPSLPSLPQTPPTVPPFLAKLWKMVNDPESDNLITWGDAGDSFVILHQASFLENILPNYYKHSNLASFVRLLNMYGFNKSVDTSGGLTTKSEKDPELEYSHPYFRRGQGFLLHDIKRKVPKKGSRTLGGAAGITNPEYTGKNLSWNIQSLYDLQFFNCPSCHYKYNSKQAFVNHAYTAHPECCTYLDNINDGSMDDVTIPNSANNYNDDETADFTEKSAGVHFMGENLKPEVEVKIEEFDDDEGGGGGVGVVPDDDQNDVKYHEDRHQNRKIPYDSNNFVAPGEDFKEENYCYICDTYFCDQKSLQVHHEIEHADIKMEQIDQKLEDNQELNCKLCGEFFYYYSDLKSHVDSAHKGTRCDECGKCFYKKANLNKHIRNVHQFQQGTKTKNHKCDLCDKAFHENGNLTEHIRRVHQGLKDHKCHLCDKGFYRRNGLADHIKIVHSGIRDHNCTECDKSFYTRSNLNAHFRTVHLKDKRERNRDEEMVTCEYCNKQLSKSNVKRHIKALHEKELQQCHQCGENFENRYRLRVHVDSVHSEDAKEECKHCGVLYFKNYMATHVKLVHDKIKDHMCQTCGRSFSMKTTLKRHEEDAHNTVKDLPCPHCGKLFKHNYKNVLRTHIKQVHEGVKDFMCTYCGKAFAGKGMMVRHVQTVHKGMKRFKCHLCTNAYGQSHELKKHLVGFHKKEIPKNRNIFELQKEMT